MNLKIFTIRSLLFYRLMPIYLLVGLLIQHFEYSIKYTKRGDVKFDYTMANHVLSDPDVFLIELVKCASTGFNYNVYQFKHHLWADMTAFFYSTYNYLFGDCKTIYIEVALVNLLTLIRYIWYLLGIVYIFNIVNLMVSQTKN